MTFRVGQKVVCIAGPIAGGFNTDIQPVIGCIYTIRAVIPDPVRGFSFWLEELIAPNHPCDGVECSFYSSRFRPAVSRKTSIEIFTRMLNPSKVDANA